jgi:hypothetical protein
VRRREPENRSRSGIKESYFFFFPPFFLALFLAAFFFFAIVYGFKIYTSNILSYKKVST